MPGTFNFTTLSVSNAQVTEGGQAKFTISIDQPLTEDLVVAYHTAYSGSADPGKDYVDVPYDQTNPTTVVIPAGQTTAIASIQTIDDTTFEPDETFKLVIDSAKAMFPDPSDPTGVATYTENYATPTTSGAIGTIVNNDAQPTVNVSDTSGFAKGNGGTGTLTFHVTLTNASATPIFVDYSTQDFTANASVDYRLNKGTLTFAPGETEQDVTVEILPNASSQGLDQESLFLNLTAVQGATSGDLKGVGTIYAARYVSITDAYANGEGDPSGTTTAQFIVSLTDANGNPSSVPSGQTIFVNYSTQNGTATVAGGDYIPVTNGLLTFNQFDSSQPIFITVNQNHDYKGDEAFQVNISSTLGTVEDGTGMGHILVAQDVVSTLDSSGQAVVKVYNSITNTMRFSFNPYPGFPGRSPGRHGRLQR